MNQQAREPQPDDPGDGEAGPGAGRVRKRVVATGLVQGVFFRDSCRRVAAEHDVAGWVRNLPDGSVEAVFEGDPAQVERLVAWSRRGPAKAVVRELAVRAERPAGLRDFTVR